MTRGGWREVVGNRTGVARLLKTVAYWSETKDRSHTKWLWQRGRWRNLIDAALSTVAFEEVSLIVWSTRRTDSVS